MTVKEITNCIEELAPLPYAESFDNVGLLVGNYTNEVSGVLVTLDTLEETIDEAIAKNCNLIVSFHPIIFKGLKKLNGKSYVERVVLKAIQNDIAIYATHTALDNSVRGVSYKMCEVLGLKNTEVLIPKKNTIQKLTTYVPHAQAEQLRNSLFEANAGNIGNYDHCSFNIVGEGSFKGNEESNPTLGKKGEIHIESETQISVTFESRYEFDIIRTLHENHPYEEVAYEIVTTDNLNQKIGMGMIGEFDEEMSEVDFLSYVKDTMKTDCIRHSALLNKKIKKVAVLGGSGSFAIPDAKRIGADAYISADFKYHDFLVEYLTKNFTNFAIILSEKSTNPIHYI